MRRTILIVGVALLIGAGSGCAINKRRLLTIQLVATRNEIGDVLSKIKDVDTARYWKPKLKELTEREKNAKDGLQKEDKLSMDESTVMKKEFEEDIDSVDKRIGVEMTRVQADPAIWEVIREYFGGLRFEMKDFNMEPIPKKREGGQGGPGPPNMNPNNPMP